MLGRNSPAQNRRAQHTRTRERPALAAADAIPAVTLEPGSALALTCFALVLTCLASGLAKFTLTMTTSSASSSSTWANMALAFPFPLPYPRSRAGPALPVAIPATPIEAAAASLLTKSGARVDDAPDLE